MLSYLLFLHPVKKYSARNPEPKSQDTKPRVKPGVHTPLFIQQMRGVSPGLNPGFGVLRCGPCPNGHKSHMKFNIVERRHFNAIVNVKNSVPATSEMRGILSPPPKPPSSLQSKRRSL
jgi:hypothetical protein